MNNILNIPGVKICPACGQPIIAESNAEALARLQYELDCIKINMMSAMSLGDLRKEVEKFNAGAIRLSESESNTMPELRQHA